MSAPQGRFLSPDPLGGELSDPQTLNKYGYTRNNPLKFVDPTGLYDCLEDDELCLSRLADFEERRKELLMSEDLLVARAAEAYGTPGDGNGVILRFADPDDPALDAVTTYGHGLDPTTPGGIRAETVVTIDPTKGGTDLNVLIGHEGSHVADARQFISSVSNSFARGGQGIDYSLNLTQYQTESRAFQVTHSIRARANEPRNYGNCVPACSLGGRVAPAAAIETIDRLLMNAYFNGNRASEAQTLIYPGFAPPQ